MILRNQIVQCGHLHADLTAFRHPQSQRTAPLGPRSLLLGQILEQSLVSHRQPLLRAQCQRITASLPWQMLVAERFSHSEGKTDVPREPGHFRFDPSWTSASYGATS